MARKVNYAKKADKIKAQIDELVESFLSDQENGQTTDSIESPEAKIKLSDIDLEKEDNATLMKLQGRILRILNKRLKGK